MNIEEELATRPNQSLVLVEEEFHKYYFWFTLMTTTQLEEWWQELDSVLFYSFSPAPLSEKTHQELQEEALRTKDFTTMFCAFLTEPLPGEVIRTNWQDYRPLRDTHKYYELLLHMDNDSVLIKPDGCYIFHDGCEEDNIYLPKKQD
jgi:hypothetical protein